MLEQNFLLSLHALVLGVYTASLGELVLTVPFGGDLLKMHIINYSSRVKLFFKMLHLDVLNVWAQSSVPSRWLR